MRTATLRTGSLVRVDIRGRVFPAKIAGEADEAGRIPIEPLASGIGYRSASARQIKGKLCIECMKRPAWRGPRCVECIGRSML